MPDLIRHPVSFWIPAFAGMTALGYLVAGVITSWHYKPQRWGDPIVAEGSHQSTLFELRPDKVKNYDFTLRRLDSETLRFLQPWGN